MITELRTIDADELWMSPCYKRASLAIHFTWKQDWPSVSKVLPMITASSTARRMEEQSIILVSQHPLA